MAEIKSLSNFQPSEVASIQTATPKVKQLSAAAIAKFIAKHGTVLMAHSREGGYYHNAHPVAGFTSIILKAR